MKKAKAPKVPVMEQAFELNLPKLARAAKAAGSAKLVLGYGKERTVVMLSETRLATFLGGRMWVADIVAVACLKGRFRHLLKCTRAHEGNFQSLYYRNGELACRHCHRLRYRSNLAPTAVERARIARERLLCAMGEELGQFIVTRQPYKWRKRHRVLSARLSKLASLYYGGVRDWLRRQTTCGCGS